MTDKMKYSIPKCLLEYYESEVDDNSATGDDISIFAIVLGYQENDSIFANKLLFPSLEYSKTFDHKGKHIFQPSK